MSAADPVDFEEMAAEQNQCPETQRLLGDTTLQLAFHQTALNDSLEMFLQAIFAQLFPLNSGKSFLIIFTMLLTPGGSPVVVLFFFSLIFLLPLDITILHRPGTNTNIAPPRLDATFTALECRLVDIGNGYESV
jgi:hypothetical protein